MIHMLATEHSAGRTKIFKYSLAENLFDIRVPIKRQKKTSVKTDDVVALQKN